MDDGSATPQPKHGLDCNEALFTDKSLFLDVKNSRAYQSPSNHRLGIRHEPAVRFTVEVGVRPFSPFSTAFQFYSLDEMRNASRGSGTNHGHHFFKRVAFSGIHSRKFFFPKHLQNSFQAINSVM